MFESENRKNTMRPNGIWNYYSLKKETIFIKYNYTKM